MSCISNAKMLSNEYVLLFLRTFLVQIDFYKAYFPNYVTMLKMLNQLSLLRWPQ